MNSCSNYKIKELELPSQPSWDGNFFNSGILDFKDNLFELSPSAKERYVNLTKIYAKKYNISIGEGVIEKNNSFFLAPRYIVLFAVMNNERYLND